MLFECTEYGEGQPGDRELNLRTRVFRQSDGAGVVTSHGHNVVSGRDEAYDFKGNLLRSSWRLAADYKTTPDWGRAPTLEPESFETSTTYDALNRLLTVRTPDNSVARPAFNEANLLERMEVNLRGAATTTTFVGKIDYDAKGQRTRIEYGNGVGRNTSTTR